MLTVFPVFIMVDSKTSSHGYSISGLGGTHRTQPASQDRNKKREGELVGGNIKVQTVLSRLYRSRFLRSNTRFVKALDEIFN